MVESREIPFWLVLEREKETHPQAYYDALKRRFADERDRRLAAHPEGKAQFTSDLSGALAFYATDPYCQEVIPREPVHDTVEVLMIGAGFSGLLAAVRLRQRGVQSIRLVDRAADVGGTWYWNRYPGVACDVVSYDYLPLLDEMNYVPSRHYPPGTEIFAHCQAIARKFDLYDRALFQTTVTDTAWDAEASMWRVTTDRGDVMHAQFVIWAEGVLTRPKLPRLNGIETFKGHSFHTSRWDYAYTGADLSQLADKAVGIIGTGASAVQIIPELGKAAKELYVFQRTPSSIDIRDDWETDPEWAAALKPGWQAKRREKALTRPPFGMLPVEERPGMSPDERRRLQEQANIDYMMMIHRRIDEIVHDRATAEALKPWYKFMCKRPCFHNDYLPTFNRPNVHLVDTRGKGVTEIGENGPIFEGREYKVDLLIYATGFEFRETGAYTYVRGIDGLEIKEKYRHGPRTLLGMHSHGYPNLFIMGGPQASFQFNMSDALNTQADHIAQCIDHVRSNGYRTMDARQEVEAWWVSECKKSGTGNLNDPDCTPGYYNDYGKVNDNDLRSYNGGYVRYLQHLAAARREMPEYFLLT
jgi:cyclohexanone monooxygenase